MRFGRTVSELQDAMTSTEFLELCAVINGHDVPAPKVPLDVQKQRAADVAWKWAEICTARGKK